MDQILFAPALILQSVFLLEEIIKPVQSLTGQSERVASPTLEAAMIKVVQSLIQYANNTALPTHVFIMEV